MKKDISLGTLYDANKQLVLQAYKDPLPHVALAAIQKKIEDWFNMEIDCYAMLLCNERHDYTIFHLYEAQNPNPCAVAASEFIGCLTDRGDILSIDSHQDSESDSIVWEIWMRIDGEAFCYHLFRYDEAVIEC